MLFREKTVRKTLFFRCHYLHFICHKNNKNKGKKQNGRFEKRREVPSIFLPRRVAITFRAQERSTSGKYGRTKGVDRRFYAEARAPFARLHVYRTILKPKLSRAAPTDEARRQERRVEPFCGFVSFLEKIQTEALATLSTPQTLNPKT